MNRYHLLAEAFRCGDEGAVLQLLRANAEMRHANGEESLRAACWFGMERTARALVETWAAEIGADVAELARIRGNTALAEWLEEKAIRRAGKRIRELQLSFIE